MLYVLSVSGGKDSTAMWSWAKRTGLTPRRAVCCDTGWEGMFPGYDWRTYIDELSVSIGEPVKVVRAKTQFKERVLKHATFPGRVNRRRWCTPELKLEPFREELDRIRDETGEDVTVVLGIRAEESAARAKMPEREWSDFYDCEVWRPIIGWTLEQVMAEHHANRLPINPLYKMGAERVGCWPCIKASKAEIRLVSDLDPGRIEEIRALEEETGNRMFCLERSRAGRKNEPRELIPKSIDEVVRWAHTKRGGLHLAVIQDLSGCARWGLCEAPSVSTAECSECGGTGRRQAKGLTYEGDEVMYSMNCDACGGSGTESSDSE
jgi:3'-phosphoadenosine 5'-phosphosulfate sulfotransferase (PAPS reductase)/FAD synthetase